MFGFSTEQIVLVCIGAVIVTYVTGAVIVQIIKGDKK